MEPNPYEPPQAANEPNPNRRNNKTTGIARVLFLLIIGAVIAILLVRLWMATAELGW
jgi:hypothetical protein